MKFTWNVKEQDDKMGNIVRIIYSRYSKKKDRVKLIKRLLKEVAK